MKCRYMHSAVVLCAFAACSASAQNPGAALSVRVRNPVHVSTSQDSLVHIEAHLAANPVDPEHLIIGSSVFPGSGAHPHLVSFVSFDGGRSWTRSTPAVPHEPTRFPWPGIIDSWTAIGADGTAYIAALRLTERAGEIYVWRALDGGMAWQSPSLIPRGDGGSFDHPIILVAEEDPATVLVFANQSWSEGTANSIIRSRDGGRSFFSPVRVHPIVRRSQNGNIALFSNGMLATSWFTIDSENGDPPRLWLSTSWDGGGSFDPPVVITENYARTWPMLAVDRSLDPDRERLYAAWVGLVGLDGISNDLVYLSWSDDGGIRWTPPKVIHTSANTRMKNVVLAVSPEGIVGLSWHFWEGDCSRVVFTASADRGESFLELQQLSQPSCPSPGLPANRIALPGRSTSVSDRWPTGGDYHGLVATDGSRFHVAWIDSTTGTHQIWTTMIDVLPQ